MIEFREFLTEKMGYSKACAMLAVSHDVQEMVYSLQNLHIPTEVLADSGYQRDVHITLAYGFSDDQFSDAVYALHKLNWSQVVYRLENKLSKFEASDYDVIKIGVRSENKSELQKVHEVLATLANNPSEYSFENYNPHMTVAYVKKGSCDHLLDQPICSICDLFFGMERVIWSDTKGKLRAILP